MSVPRSCCEGSGENSRDHAADAPLVRASYKDVLLRSVQAESEVDWQVVRRRHARRTSGPKHGAAHLQVSIKEDSSPRRIAYLQRMKGKCFNCLGYGHFVAQCRNSTRCWMCQCSGHISTRCPKRKKIQEKQRHQKSRILGDAPKLTHKTEGTVVIVDDSLLQLGHHSPPAARDKSMDPMVLEALIMSQMHNTGSSATSPSPLALPSRVDNDLPNEEGRKPSRPDEVCKSLPLVLPITVATLPTSQNLDDFQSPLIIRTEAEQQMGHELIKALSSLKHDEIVPVPPSIMESKSSDKESIAVSPEDDQSCNQKLMFKIGSQKPIYRMVRDMLTKKWIFVREVQQLGDWTLQRFLRACKKPTGASRFELIKHRVEMSILKKAFKRLAQESEKMKKKKKTNQSSN